MTSLVPFVQTTQSMTSLVPFVQTTQSMIPPVSSSSDCKCHPKKILFIPVDCLKSISWHNLLYPVISQHFIRRPIVADSWKNVQRHSKENSNKGIQLWPCHVTPTVLNNAQVSSISTNIIKLLFDLNDGTSVAKSVVYGLHQSI